MKKLFNPFAKPSAIVLAVAELEEAKRQLLAALTAREYAEAMVTYNAERVRRLSETVKHGDMK